MHDQAHASALDVHADTPTSHSAPITGPWPAPEQAMREMQLLFHRTLGAWASDVLELRRRGMDRPGRPLRAAAGLAG